ncbi:WD40-repeat-containing domain protein [Xylariaceae sp. FL1651]|nr:WD40-repeat-containing domain protein [Xylariaceae sp. FL1651]
MCRIKSDKGGFLDDCFSWILEDSQLKDWQYNKDTRLLWIKGDPGKGKTMLMIGLVGGMTNRLRPDESCAFFFCQNTEPHLNNGVSVLRGLIWKLLSENRALSCYIPAEYRLAAKDKRKSLFESNLNKFFILKTMLSAMLRDSGFETVYLLIDALDECDKDSDKLVEWIADDAADPQSKAKWLVSGRPHQMLEETFRPDGRLQKLSLELNHEHVSQAVSLFIKRKAEVLAKKKRYNTVFWRTVEQRLMEKAESTFLWVALVCQRLEKIPRRETLVELNKLPSKLQPLYGRMMQLIEDQEGSSSEICKQTLRAVTIAYIPLTLDEIVPMAGLHERPIEDISELVSLCGSYVILQGTTIRFVHQSAKDYLNDVAEFFPGGREQEHGRIVERSLQAMSTILRRNIYNLHYPGLLISKIRSPDPDPLTAIRYSCVHWIGHFCDAYSSSPPGDQVCLRQVKTVDKFLRKNFLYWLEALGLIEYMRDAILSMARLESLLRAYVLAFIFSPDEEPKWIKPNPTLDYHNEAVQSVAFSHDSKLLASGSHGCAIKIWDADNGNFVGSVAFFHDSKFLVSELYNTIMIWDTATGSFYHTLEGYYVSGSDNTTKIWDTATGSLQQPLEGRGNFQSPYCVTSVALSCNPGLLAAGLRNGSLQQSLKGHYDPVVWVTFSRNNRILVSASANVIKTWNTATGFLQQTFGGHNCFTDPRTLPYYCRLLASGSRDSTKIWDAATRSLQHTLEGYEKARYPLHALSHDSKLFVSGSHDIPKIWDTATGGLLLASGSDDGTIKIWDVAARFTPQTLFMGRPLSHLGNSVAFSYESKLLASGSDTLKGHNNWVISVAFSHNSKLLALGSCDNTIKIWDTVTGSLQKILEGYDKSIGYNCWVGSVAFSYNSKLLASALHDMTIKIRDAATGPQYYGYALSCDGSWITWNQQNVLWLPPNYRSHKSAISSLASPSAPDSYECFSLESCRTRNLRCCRLWATASASPCPYLLTSCVSHCLEDAPHVRNFST